MPLDTDVGVMAYVLQFAPQDFAHYSTLRDDSVPPLVCLPPFPGTEFHQLADHLWRDTLKGPHHFPAHRRTRRGSDPPAKGRPPSCSHHTLGERVFSTAFSLWESELKLEAADLVVHHGWEWLECRMSLRRAIRAGAATAEAQHQLGQPRRLHLQPDSRLQSGARRLDHAERLGAADLRRAGRSRCARSARSRARSGEVVEVAGSVASRSPRRAAASEVVGVGLPEELEDERLGGADHRARLPQLLRAEAPVGLSTRGDGIGRHVHGQPAPMRSSADISTQTWASMPARITRRACRGGARALLRRPSRRNSPSAPAAPPGRASRRSSGKVWPRPLGYCSVASTGRRRRRAVVARILMFRMTSSR